MENGLHHRKSDYPVEQQFLRRWSPRALSGAPVKPFDLMTLFEAARWAPSTYNEQEWRFVYAHRDTPQWEKIFDLLYDPNKAWCKDAGVLCVVISKKTFTKNGKPNPVHTFDAGSAFMSLSLQAAHMGLVVHGMAGFDYEKAAKDLGVPDDYKVEAMFAVGHPGDVSKLAKEMADIEKPSPRKPVSEIVREGTFTF